jgi:hypothetical protein
MLTMHGEMQRLTSVVVLKVEDGRGHMLVQLAKFSGSGGLKTFNQLPGGKQLRGELVLDTLERLMEGPVLSALSEQLEVVKVEKQATWKQSEEFNVCTKYLRYIVSAKLAHGQEEFRNVLELPSFAPSPSASCCLSSGQTPPFQKQISPDGNTSEVRKPSFQRSASLLFRRPSLDPTSLRASLGHRSVFHMGPSLSEGGLFVWLTESELETLKGPLGEEVMPGWLESLQERLTSTEAKRLYEQLIQSKEEPAEMEGEMTGVAHVEALVEAGNAAPNLENTLP